MCNMQPRTLLAAQKHLEQIYVGKRTHFLRVAIHKTHRLRETGGAGEEDTFGKMEARGICGHWMAFVTYRRGMGKVKISNFFDLLAFKYPPKTILLSHNMRKWHIGVLRERYCHGIFSCYSCPRPRRLERMMASIGCVMPSPDAPRPTPGDHLRKRENEEISKQLPFGSKCDILNHWQK